MSTRTISGTREELIPQNNLRKSLLVQNQDTAIAIFIKREPPGNNTVSSTDHDIQLASGSSLTLNLLEDGQEQVQERYTVIAASGNPRISIFETIDRPIIKEFRQ